LNTNEKWFYENHLKVLKSLNIMTQIERPLIRKELRVWVWEMLRRAGAYSKS
jgi:hypothetical protein